MNVFRVYGAAVNSAVSNGGILTINGLARVSNGPTSEFSSVFQDYGTLSYTLNTTNINLSPPNNTFPAGYSESLSFGTNFGGGLTITSLYYNIFASSTLAFELPPANTATTCTIFGYVYNEIENVVLNVFKNKQWFYLTFCPIDSALSLSSSNANVKFLNPQYPNVFTNGFSLGSILSYGISNQIGNLRAFKS